MTKRIGNIIYIEETSPAACSQCGKVEELRPYGPAGTSVCFECAMKDEPNAMRRLDRLLGLDRPDHKGKEE